ncbi:MAG: hypothetical protein ABI379_07560 [Rhodanobacter sp.]
MTRKSAFAWFIATVVAFILGFLLAWWLLHQRSFNKPACPAPDRPAATATETAGANAMQGGAAPAAGKPAVLPGGGEGSADLPPSTGSLEGSGGPPPPGASGGQGEVEGSLGGGQGSIAPADSSGGLGGNSDGGDIDTGGGKGKLPANGDESTQASDPSVAPRTGFPITPATSGPQSPRPGDQDAAANDPVHQGDPVVAPDYRYDKSGLAHYPNAIKVASGTEAASVAAAAGPDTRNFSVTEIVTSDAPDVVAAWYHDDVPAGWNELQMPSAAAMDQAIQQTGTPAANASPVDAMLNTLIVNPQLKGDKPGVDAARAAGLTIFQPPDQTTDPRMIIVIRDSKTGQTGVLLMKKKVGQE